MQRPTVDIHAERAHELAEARFDYFAGLMAHAAHDGRPPMPRTVMGDAPTDTVNGQEVRGSQRWSRSQYVPRLHHDPDVNPCRVSKDGGRTWETFEAPEREPRERTRKVTDTTGHADAYDALIAAVGTTADYD